MNFCSTSLCMPSTNFKINVAGIGNCVTEVKHESNKDNFVVWNKTNGEDGGNALGDCSTTKFDLTQVDLIVLAEKLAYVFKHLEFYIEKFKIAS